jgi:hypothetical protein
LPFSSEISAPIASALSSISAAHRCRKAARSIGGRRDQSGKAAAAASIAASTCAAPS